MNQNKIQDMYVYRFLLQCHLCFNRNTLVSTVVNPKFICKRYICKLDLKLLFVTYPDYRRFDSSFFSWTNVVLNALEVHYRLTQFSSFSLGYLRFEGYVYIHARSRFRSETRRCLLETRCLIL